MQHIWRITRPGSRFDWARRKDPLDREVIAREVRLDGVPCFVVEYSQVTGGQAHFYMETQACIALPVDGVRLPAAQGPRRRLVPGTGRRFLESRRGGLGDAGRRAGPDAADLAESRAAGPREPHEPAGDIHGEDPRGRDGGAGDNLQADGAAAGPARHRAQPDAKLGGSVDSFCGFTYPAALSVVEVDVLTGESKILSSDLVYDMGSSLNPAIDIGQVEGAFVLGIGYLLTEQLVFEEEGDEKGRLNTTNTWRYKVPATTTIPLELNTHLFPRDLKPVAAIPDEPGGVFSAKEAGEPPLVLANSVFFALKAAIRASRLERGRRGLFRFDAPATVQDVRRACDVSIEDFAS